MKGVKFLAIALPLAFIGPSIIYSAFGNRDKPLYIPVLILGFAVAVTCGYFIFKGIRTMMRALFDE